MNETDRHIDRILDLISKGEWGPSKLREYCRQHGTNYNTACGYSSQAWRIHKKLRGDDGEYRERLLANLDYAARWARELDDVNAYIKAQDSQSKLLVQQPTPDTERVDTNELRRLIEAAEANEHATEPADQTGAGRSDQDRGGEREAKGRVEGFESSDD